ncbi:MAG TPA: hypothetical protein VNB90_13475 [Cytophagaceae bacterium]|jgi:hypothetical protein|nr:hypothetical protein [Cytophagaceae bacterium]
MNWKLIFQLSLFGLAMAFATVFWLPQNIQPAFWLPIFIFCAYQVAKKCSGKYFLNGFMISMINAVWITTVHIIFFETLMANNPEMAKMNADMPMPGNPRLMMLLMGPVFGMIFGLILGTFSFVASKIVKK